MAIWQPLPYIPPPSCALPQVKFATFKVPTPPIIQYCNPPTMIKPPQLIQAEPLPSIDIPFELLPLPDVIKITNILDELIDNEITILKGLQRTYSVLTHDRNITDTDDELTKRNTNALSEDIVNKETKENGQLQDTTLSSTTAEDVEAIIIDGYGNEIGNEDGISTEVSTVNEHTIREKNLFKYAISRQNYLNKMAGRNLAFIAGHIQKDLLDISIEEKQEILHQTIHNKSVSNQQSRRLVSDIDNILGNTTTLTNRKGSKNSFGISTGITLEKQNTVTTKVGTGTQTSKAITTEIENTTKTEIAVDNKQSNSSSNSLSNKQRTSRDDEDNLSLIMSYLNKVSQVSIAKIKTELAKITGNLRNSASAISSNISSIENYIANIDDYTQSLIFHNAIDQQTQTANNLYTMYSDISNIAKNKFDTITKVGEVEVNAQNTLANALSTELKLNSTRSALMKAYEYKELINSIIIEIEQLLSENTIIDYKNQASVAKTEGILLKLKSYLLELEGLYAREKGKSLGADAKLAGVRGILEADRVRYQAMKELLNIQIERVNASINRLVSEIKKQVNNGKQISANKLVEYITKVAAIQEVGYGRLGLIEGSAARVSAQIREQVQADMLENLGEIDGSMAEAVANLTANVHIAANLSHIVNRGF